MELYELHNVDVLALLDVELPKDDTKRCTTSFQLSRRLRDFLKTATKAIDSQIKMGHKLTQGSIIRRALTDYLGREDIAEQIASGLYQMKGPEDVK